MPDELIPLADHVWYFPYDPDPAKVQPNVGVICSNDQTVLVDGGSGPINARQILSALKKISAPPVKHVIYTHHHWDHVFGASVFAAPTIGHRMCREMLLKAAARPWGPKYIEEEIKKNPRLEQNFNSIRRAVDNWSEFRILPPSITFSDEMDLCLDGVTVNLQYVGGEHAIDSSVVRVRESKAIFLGDCFYVPPTYRRTPDSKGDAAMLKSLIDDSMGIYIHSHGPPATRAQMLGRLEKM